MGIMEIIMINTNWEEMIDRTATKTTAKVMTIRRYW